MRISIKIIALSLLFFTSCEDWLDIRPEGESMENQMFEKGEGYRSVLNGIYQSMGSENLYGRELTYGVLDCMAQQYNLSTIYVGSYGIGSLEKYVAAGKLDYSNVHVSRAVETIWEAGFKVIANANSLIQNTETASSDLFALGEMERKMILGEAYACRAFMHFDLLRLYAPALTNDDKGAYVPYVESYPNTLAGRIAVEPFLNKVIVDLKHAKTLLIDFDTAAITKSFSASGKIRFRNENVMPGFPAYQKEKSYDSFFRGRGYRLSYYAVTALLARVYQYAGLHKEAYDEAQQVMGFEQKGSTTTYKFFSQDDFSGITSNSNFNQKSDVKVLSNLVFAVYNQKMYDMGLFKEFFNQKPVVTDHRPWLVSNLKQQKTFYTSDENIDEFRKDYRGELLMFNGSGNEAYPICGKWFISDNEAIRNNNITVLPMIRSTEMRYIMAEYYARNNKFVDAQKILTEIRTNRGCAESISIMDWNSFVKELVCDARREWIAEGQLFYLYKRLNANVNFGEGGVRPLKREEYLLPVPTNQIL